MAGLAAGNESHHGGPVASKASFDTGLVIGVAAATFVGAWLRMALAFASGLWRDEAQSLAISQLPTIADLVSFLARQDSHPPLFYLAERWWVAVFGSSDAAVVAIGLLPGTLVIPTAAVIAWRLVGARAGTLAAWFTAIAWPLVWQSGDARPYPFLSLITLLTATAALAASTRRTIGWWCAYALGCLMMLYTHNWWVLVVATLALLTLAGSLRTGGRAWPAIRPWLTAHAIVAALYLPWVPTVMAQARAAGYAPPTYFPLEWVALAAIFLLGVNLKLLAPVVGILLLGTWRVGRGARGGGSIRHFLLVAAVPCLFALLAWSVSDLASSYCASALSPLALVAIAGALGREGTRATKPRQCVAAGLTLAALAVSMGFRWYAKSNVREAASIVSARAAPGDLVIVFPSSMTPVFERYHASEAEVISLPPQASTAPTRFAGWWKAFDDPDVLTEARHRFRAARATGRSVWLVSQYRRDYLTDSLAVPGTRERFRFSIGARLRELRSHLETEFGPPGLGFTPEGARWRREMVELERYAPPGEGP